MLYSANQQIFGKQYFFIVGNVFAAGWNSFAGRI